MLSQTDAELLKLQTDIMVDLYPADEALISI